MRFGLSLMAAAIVSVSTISAFGEAIVLQTDKSQLITLSSEPGTVVVGNPSIADVSINGKQIFLHGHAFGDTNLLILDAQGSQIANFDVTVTHSNSNAVAIFKAGIRYSYTCAPNCESTMQQGDNDDYMQNTTKEGQKKAEFATGKTSVEASAPKAPQ
jgi:Flp pilus assembly secretin CpaC